MKRALSKKNLWENSPSWLRSTIGRGLGFLPLAFVMGKTFQKQRETILEAQWWSTERSREYQLKKLREILKIVYEKTTFYRHMFDSLGFRPEDMATVDEMNQLPLTDKKVVAENLSDMCTKSVKNIDVDFGSTGGKSGEPLNFYLNANRSYTEYAYLVSSWERTGYRLRMPMAILRGKAVRVDRSGLYHEYDPILRYHYYSSFHMSDENMARYLQHISTIGSCFLHVYPSTVAALVRFIRRSDQKVPNNIRGIITESEIVYPEQRRMVEEVFGCRYFSCYGQSEKVVLAAGCEKSDNYHVWPTYGYFELLDNHGNLVNTPGQRGEIVGTGFINTVMPFIRYRTGDWATYVGDRCEACGREHILLRDIRGHRTQEVMIATDGSEIPWVALNMHDDTFNHVRRFQFFQEVPGKAILQIVPSDGFGKNDTDRIKRSLGRKFEDRLTFTIELVEEIRLSARGKAIYVDQRIQGASNDTVSP